MGVKYSINKHTVGLIVRGKKNDKHVPGNMEQHADCILPGGEPVGFYGGAGDYSSGSSATSSSLSSENGPFISLNSSGLNMKGQVAYYDELIRIRPMYVNLELAKRYKIRSTVILLEVTRSQAELFTQFWKNLKLNPGVFNIIGGNCSTHASEAFVAAKILASGIPGLDTPDNLYRQIKNKFSGRKLIYSGFVAVSKSSGNNYDLVIEQ